MRAPRRGYFDAGGFADAEALGEALPQTAGFFRTLGPTTHTPFLHSVALSTHGLT
jgi:hypothetical protein